MATALHGKGSMAVGSSDWITQEREQISQFQEQELEDFVFSVRNETEWLNEHMADVFNNTQLNVTEIFKTPGKLRGKTPRTARRRSPEPRAPLSEIFSADKRYNVSPHRALASPQALKNFQSPTRDHSPLAQRVPLAQQRTKQPHDSGYQGMTEDEMDIDGIDADMNALQSSAESMQVQKIEQEQPKDDRLSNERRTTEGSFHSARENVTSRDVAMTDAAEVEPKDLPGSFPEEPSLPTVPQNGKIEVSNAASTSKELVVDDVAYNGNHAVESPDSSMDGSSPPKTLMRKSSLTFATLPAREPLATKKSIGNQGAGTSSVDTSKGTLNRSSYFGRFTGGKSLGATKNAEDDRMDLDTESEDVGGTKGDDEQLTRLHNKSSTQRLHERINLLGKTQPARPTKSIPSTANVQASYPDLVKEYVTAQPDKGKAQKDNRSVKAVLSEPTPVDEEEDWIMPSAPKSENEENPILTKSRSVDVMEDISGRDNISGAGLGLKPGDNENSKQQSPLRSRLPQESTSPFKFLAKSASTTQLPTVAQNQGYGHQKLISVSNPEFPNAITTTPTGSPTSKFHLDGHLSASKHKLQSIMKSARGLFSSSARVSNQAKMETMSPSPMRVRNVITGTGLNEIAEVSSQDPPIYPDLPQLQPDRPESPSRGRKTRSSTEREKEEKRKEKEAKERQKADAELARVREQERQKAAKQQEKLKNTAQPLNSMKAPTLEQSNRPVRQSPRRLQNQEKQTVVHEPKATPAVASGSTRPASQASQIAKPKEIRRPVKPARDVAPKPRPAPVAIRVGTFSQRIPLTSSTLSSQQDTGPSGQAKPGMSVKKASTVSQQTAASTASLKSSVSSTASRPKAPIVRKIERKPTAQEEAQKKLQQKETERGGILDDPKKTAQKQAIEKRRLDMAKKDQQNDSHHMANDLAQTLQTEKPTAQALQRPELSATRTLPKINSLQDFPRPPTAGSAKPKRVFDPDQEDELARPVRLAAGQNFQQSDTKRRRTGDEDLFEQPAQTTRPAMAPPIRQSSIRKDPLKTSLFGGNYPMAPPPAIMHAGPSRPMAQGYQPPPQPHTAHQQRPMHPIDMAKFTNGKIPFAEQPNPPQQAVYKTPLHKQTNTLRPPPSQFSPIFQNPENIVLDDIETSEDEEDSEDERAKKRSLPDWTRTPNMNDILLQQEAVDTDAVFGPVAPANLEEWFTKDKNRLHKLRMRTSSANWFGADRLTEDEIKKDAEARQKMSKDGGWSFGLSKLNE